MSTQGIKKIPTSYGHRYTINGENAVGVTTALNALPKNLTRWAARTVAEHVADHWHTVGEMLASGGRQPTIDYLSGLPHQRRDEAAVRGTLVHDLVYQLAEGIEVAVPGQVAPYVRGALAYLDDWQPTTVIAEAVVASYEHKYAGTLDSIQHLPSLGTVLVDWKTGRGIYGNHALQLAAYRYAEVYLDQEGIEHPMIELDDTYILHIQPENYSLIPVTADTEQFKTFLAVLEVYRRAVQSNRLDALIGSPLSATAGVVEVTA